MATYQQDDDYDRITHMDALNLLRSVATAHEQVQCQGSTRARGDVAECGSRILCAVYEACHIGTRETHGGVVVGGYALFLQFAESPGECSQRWVSIDTSILSKAILGDAVLQ